VAFWPLGLLEHHGWHLPVGFDGVKAERTCKRVAERTGGVLLPTMWWGGGGGHGPFHWTLYQDAPAYTAILVETVSRLLEFGFRAIVLLAGHYPWQSALDKVLPQIVRENPQALLVWGTEMSIGGPGVRLSGDHAAKEETSSGLCLLPELVDLDALRGGRGSEAWPGGEAPAESDRHPGVCFDPASPLFAQMGADAREASAEHGEAEVSRLVEALSVRIQAHLA